MTEVLRKVMIKAFNLYKRKVRPRMGQKRLIKISWGDEILFLFSTRGKKRSCNEQSKCTVKDLPISTTKECRLLRISLNFLDIRRSDFENFALTPPLVKTH